MSKIKIINAIKKSERVLVTAHMSPDLDALCSQLSIALYCKELGKQVSVVNNCEVPSRYKFIAGISQIKKVSSSMKANFDLAIILDCGEYKRIGKVKNLISDKTIKINLDHHVSNDFFGNINYIDSKSSSTCEIVYELLKKAGMPLTKDLAMYIYIGILTDTGSFRYSNTSSRTHKIVSELMQFDLHVDKLYRKIYESMPYEDFAFFAKIVGQFKELHEKKVIYFEFDQKAQDQFSKEFDLRETTLNFLRLVKGIELIIIFSVIDPCRTRVNFRSTDKINVAQLSEKFGGGGHKRASGCMIDAPLKKAKRTVLNDS